VGVHIFFIAPCRNKQPDKNDLILQITQGLRCAHNFDGRVGNNGANICILADKVIQAAHGAIHHNNKKDNNIRTEFGGVQS
jgi:hypothetical protein